MQLHDEKISKAQRLIIYASARDIIYGHEMFQVRKKIGVTSL